MPDEDSTDTEHSLRKLLNILQRRLREPNAKCLYESGESQKEDLNNNALPEFVLSNPVTLRSPVEYFQDKLSVDLM